MARRLSMSVALSAGCVVLAFLVNHESVRLTTPFAQWPGSQGLLGLCLLLMGLGTQPLAWRGVGARSRRMLVGVLIATGYLTLAVPVGLISWHNAASQLRAAQRPVARAWIAPPRLIIDGRIDASLPARIDQLLESENVSIVEVGSYGGDIAAAELAGRILAKHAMPVLVRDHCASACVLLWSLAPLREAQEGACFGFHRAHLGDLAPATGIARTALEKRQSRSAEALLHAGFDALKINRSLSSDPRNVLWLSTSDLEQMGVVFTLVPDARRQSRGSLLSAAVGSACGN